MSCLTSRLYQTLFIDLIGQSSRDFTGHRIYSISKSLSLGIPVSNRGLLRAGIIMERASAGCSLTNEK